MRRDRRIAMTGPRGPFVASIAPATGVAAGGTAVTINGAGFTSTTTLRLASGTPNSPGSGTALTSVVLVSPSQMTAVTPAGSAGLRTLMAVYNDGIYDFKMDCFTYT